MESSKAVNYTKNSHHFKFKYSQIKDMKREEFVSSPVFHVFGQDWVVECYPRGSCKVRYRLYTCVTFIVRVLRDQGESNKKVDPTFSCSLMENGGTMCPLLPHVQQKEGIVVFKLTDKPSHSRGYIYIENLENGFVIDGSFELICSISNTDKYTMVVPKSFGLHRQIGKLLENSETGDVTFDVENRSFTCHRLILAARSNVLKAELFGNMAEATQKCIKIKDMSSDVFEAMLRFLYTDSFLCPDSENTTTELAQHLFEAADRYAIEGLKAVCEKHLCASISVDTVVSNLALAEKHNSLQLKNSCLEFIAEPGTPISWTLTDEYVDLVRSFPSLMAEIRAKVDAVLSLRNSKRNKT